MRSYIRVYIDEDADILKTVTLGPAVSEYVKTLSWNELTEFLDVFNDLITIVWAREAPKSETLESGDD